MENKFLRHRNALTTKLLLRWHRMIVVFKNRETYYLSFTINYYYFINSKLFIINERQIFLGSYLYNKIRWYMMLIELVIISIFEHKIMDDGIYILLQMMNSIGKFWWAIMASVGWTLFQTNSSIHLIFCFHFTYHSFAVCLVKSTHTTKSLFTSSIVLQFLFLHFSFFVFFFLFYIFSFSIFF